MRTRSLRGATSVPAPHRTVARPRLLRRLDAAARAKLTLVVAPQGSGKSVLLSQWASTRRDVAAFLSCERVDSSRELAALLVEPLPRLKPTVIDLEMFSEDPGERALDEAFLGQLVEVYDSLPEAVLVIIDCLDGLATSAHRDTVLALIAHTASHIHFVVAVRSEQVLRRVAHQSALRNDVAYMREADLLFDRDEARELLRSESRRRLDDADVGTLVSRTEGWAAGLHLAALSLRAADDVAGWVDRFGGADEYIARYFDEVVMPTHSAAMQHFLLTTSVLDHLSGSLCDAVTGTADAETMLQLLDEQSVLRRRQVRGTEVFVHHRLFREYLQTRFRASHPEDQRRALGRAADWYLERDDVEGAVRYLIAGRDWERVLDAVAVSGRKMFEQARPAVALAWLEAVPASVREGRNEIVLQHAVLREMSGDSLGAEEIIRGLGDPETLPSGVRAMADTLRSTWIEAHLTPEAVIEAADRALRLLDTLRPDEVVDVFGISSARDQRVIAATSRARATWFRGDVDTASTALARLLEEGDLYRTWHLNILGTLALLEAWRGMLVLAEQYATYAFRITADGGQSYAHPSLGNAYLAMSHVLLQRNDPRRAELVLVEAFEAVTHGSRYPVALARHAVEHAHLDLTWSRPRAALQRLREFEGRQPALPPLIAARFRAMRARALLGIDEPARAERALDLDGTAPTVEVAVTAVQLALLRNDAVTAQKVLNSWPHDSGSWSQLNCTLAQALIADAQGDRPAALRAMEEVVAAAEPEGHVLLFLEAGPGAQRLLRALFRSHPTAFVRRLVRPEHAAQPQIGTNTGDSRALLSERELLVLRYLPSRMTHAEIAAELFVSVNTVKTQVRSIYTKLGARGRRDAIARAEALDLL